MRIFTEKFLKDKHKMLNLKTDKLTEIHHLNDMVEIGKRNLPEWMQPTLEKGLKESFASGNHIAGAFHDGVLAGWINAKKRDYDNLGSETVPMVLIILLVVDKNLRRRGIGRTLLVNVLNAFDYAAFAAYALETDEVYGKFLEASEFEFKAQQDNWFADGAGVKLYTYSKR